MPGITLESQYTRPNACRNLYISYSRLRYVILLPVGHTILKVVGVVVDILQSRRLSDVVQGVCSSARFPGGGTREGRILLSIVGLLQADCFGGHTTLSYLEARN